MCNTTVLEGTALICKLTAKDNSCAVRAGEPAVPPIVGSDVEGGTRRFVASLIRYVENALCTCSSRYVR